MEKFCSKCGKELINGKCECCDKEEIRFSKNGIINRPRLKEAAKLTVICGIFGKHFW